ncbi:Abcb1a [Symbiodinium sp. CCMP2592]|nr:Abcb1a [Symbiodinium sp. CCMP2592]
MNGGDSGGKVEDPPNLDVQRFLEIARMAGRPVGLPTFPWEQSPFVQNVLGTSVTPWLEHLAVPSNLPYLETQSEPMTLQSKQAKVRIYIDRAASSCAATDRSLALRKWSELLLINPGATAAGRQLIDETSKHEDENQAWQILQDHFARKSTSTLRTRVNSLCLFCRWFNSEFPHQVALPPTEESVYKYLCHLRKVGAPATRGSTFMGSLAFLSGFMGMSDAEAAAFSQRALGVAHLMYVSKSPLKRAPALTIPMICILELAAEYESDLYTRAFAGFALMLLFGRMRCSDGNRLECGAIEGKFLEGSLMKVKTARTKEKQVSFLPVVVPAIGLLGFSWLESFASARSQLGLNPLPTERDRRTRITEREKFVFFPSEATVGSGKQSAISAADVSQRLRELLSKLLPFNEVQDYSSHSLKATMLSMFNKYGEDHYLDEAQLLGYHVLPGRQSVLNYTRDALARPIRVFTEMISCVSEGSFMPDNSRGNLFPEIDNQICAQSQFEKHIGMTWKQAIEVLSGKCFLKSEQMHPAKGNQSDVHGDVPDEGVSSEVRPAMLPEVGMEATFEARAREIGFSDAEIAVFKQQGWDTFGRLAFAKNYTPGQTDDQPLIELAAIITNTAPPPPNRVPLVRRIVFESYTFASADLKSRIDRKDDDTPRKLAVAERASRHQDQVRRLRGLNLVGELEASHSLIDAVVQMYDDNQLRYLRWDQCTKRDQELMGIKSDPMWKPDANGVIKEVKTAAELKADTSTDLKLKFALQRRSLAFDQTRLIDYDKMERWTQVLIDAFLEVPPANYAKVTIEQVHNADLALFKYMMKETRFGIKPLADGTLPLERALQAAMAAPEVRLCLQPLQAPGGPKRKADEAGLEEAPSSKHRTPAEPSKAKTEEERLRRQVQNLQGQVKNLQAQRGMRERKSSRSHLAHTPKLKPLRSEFKPEGLDDLSEIDQKRVGIANKIFCTIATFLSACADRSIAISVGHPTKSLLWKTCWFKDLQQKHGLHSVDFQQCIWGGRSNRWYTIRCNFQALTALRGSCQGGHKHALWGELRSGSDIEFPPRLCRAFAVAVQQHALELGAQQVKTTGSEHASAAKQSRRMAQAGKQPRGNKLPPVISEFESEIWVLWDLARPGNVPQKLTQSQCQHFSIETTAKLLEFCEVGDPRYSSLFCPVQDASSCGVQRCGVQLPLARLGVYRTPQRFVQEALEAEHPFDGTSMLDDDALRAMFVLLTEGPEGVRKRRQAAFDFYEQLSRSLEEAEQQIHNAMDPDREELVHDKKFLLFKSMCEHAGVEDAELSTLQIVGAELTGIGGYSNLFDPVEAVPALTQAQVMKAARWTRRKVLGRQRPDDDTCIAEAVWTATLDEVSKGWLSGPYSESEVAERLGPLFVASRRFGLEQSDKVRMIDDMSETLVNAGFASSYKLDLGGVDEVVVLCRAFVEAVFEDRTVVLRLSSGTELRGLLHSSLTVQQAKTLVGRTLDLEAAYKQMLIAKASQWAGVLTVRNPSGGNSLFIANVLPFGGSSAVYSFNRLSRALHRIGSRLFFLVWGNYYDDFPQIDLEACGDEAQYAAERLLSLLGWRFSRKDSKRRPAARKFDALGVTVDLSESSLGKVKVGNKASRVEQISGQVAQILATGRLTVAVAAALRGRLQFAESHMFGRIVRQRMRRFHKRACGSDSSSHINSELRDELEWARDFVRVCRPRYVEAARSATRAVIFTDAALEDNDSVASVGAVIYLESNDGQRMYHISAAVPEALLRHVQQKSPKVIACLELMAAVATVCKIAPLLKGRRVFCYIDNEAARACMVNMFSPVLAMNRLVQLLSSVVWENSTHLWVSRVPSDSNIADAPSRLDCTLVDSLNSQLLTFPWALVRDAL